MANCEFYDGCSFLSERLGKMPRIAGLYRMQFCEGNCTSCARYMVYKFVGFESVPRDLYPNQQERADIIIAETEQAA
jgi:hypothetical protein